MKNFKKNSLFLLMFLICNFNLLAQQIPQSFNYQAIARTLDGTSISKKDIIVEINILKTNINGNLVYREIHNVVTDDFGMFQVEIGKGTPTFDAQIQDFSQIEWLNDYYYLNIRIDFEGNEILNGLTDLGTMKLQSVPYSLASKSAIYANNLSFPVQLKLSDLSDIDFSQISNNQIIYWNSDIQKWQNKTQDLFLKADGSVNLTQNWTITGKNLTITNSDFNVISGKIICDSLRINSNVITSITTDGTLNGNSDFSIPTEKAVKTFVTANGSGNSWTSNANYIYVNNSKNIGIGTSTPSHKFEIQLDNEQGILFSGTFGGTVPDLGSGSRMSFYPGKAAFRAGRLENQPTFWNNDFVGNYSAAFGYDTKASGDFSFVCGSNNQVTGNNSFASGTGNNATGLNSLTFGENNSSPGINSAAFGTSTISSGKASMTIGNLCKTGNTSGIGGDYSLAIGNNTMVEGTGGFASGNLTTARGNFSAAFGENTLTSSIAVGSVVFGISSTAVGQYSLASGFSTFSGTFLESVFGRYNASIGNTTNSWVATESLFSIGNGTGASAKSNALVVMKNGNVGIGLGSASPAYKLDIAGDARANNWLTSSDSRLKKDIILIDNPIQKLAELNGYYYFWQKGSTTTRQVGVIAQEVEKVLPELVVNDTNGFKAVDYPKLSALLIEVAKNQQTQIVELKQQTEKLKVSNIEMNDKIDYLETKIEDLEKYIKAAANIKMNNEQKDK